MTRHGATARSLKASQTILGHTSPGVKRIQEIAEHITLPGRIVLFVGIFLLSYVYSLDITLRGTFQPVATDSFKTHSLLATVAVLRSAIATAAQPTAAKIADVFGRLELLLVSVIFYVTGTIVDATSHGVAQFAAGAILYQIGYTCVALLTEVLIADFTSVRARLLFSHAPLAPFLINAWVSGNVADSVLERIGWRWGVGMWAIIYPASVVPLLTVLYLTHRKAKASRGPRTADSQGTYKIRDTNHLASALFWQLDVPGITLIIAIICLVMVPLTLAGGVQESWREAHIIAPIVIGVLCVPVLVMWETRAPHPALPFRLLKDRMVWGGLGVIFFTNCASAVQNNYLYTVLVVAFNQSVLSATRIVNLYAFSSTIVGVFVGLAVMKVRRLKYFVVSGSLLNLVGFGLMVRYVGGSMEDYGGMVASQIVIGVAVGLSTYASLASVQSATLHEHVAIVTGVYFACFSVGGAVGNAIAGAIWTQILPDKLLESLGDANLAASVYGAPFTAIEDYPWDNPIRTDIVDAYRKTQRILCITALCLSTLIIFSALSLRDPYLTSDQTLAVAGDEQMEAGDKREGMH